MRKLLIPFICLVFLFCSGMIVVRNFPSNGSTPIAIVSQTQQNGSTINMYGSYRSLGQSFQVSTATQLTKIRFMPSYVGTSPNVTVRIGTSEDLTTNYLGEATVTSLMADSWAEADFSPAISLSANTTYYFSICNDVDLYSDRITLYRYYNNTGESTVYASGQGQKDGVATCHQIATISSVDLEFEIWGIQ